MKRARMSAASRIAAFDKEDIAKDVQGWLTLEQKDPGMHFTAIELEYLDSGIYEDGHIWIDYAIDTRHRHMNVYEILHGGVAATLFDDCIGIAGSVARGEQYVTTSSMSLEYVRAMKGKRFRLHTEITHVGGHMVTGHGELYDEKERLCVSCMASYTIHTDKADGPGRAL